MSIPGDFTNQVQRALCRARIDFSLVEQWKSILWVA